MKTLKIFLEDARKALAFATDAHRGQTRSDKSPYINHPIRVAQHVAAYKTSKNMDALMSAAYLHDTIEDSGKTTEELEALFGKLAASLVQELTSDKAQIEKLGKTAYLAKKMETMSSYALVIKLADRLDNVSDLKTAKSETWRNKYRAETKAILDHIEQNRKLSGTHRRIISAIRKKIQEI